MPSRLAIFDLDDDSTRTVLRTSLAIASPSFTPDGAALIVNHGGRLWRVPLDAPRLLPVETGPAVHCNNDHGPSPDGRWLALTDRPPDGEATIHLVPLAGGAPRRLTTGGPSYWHGWSPDGAQLVYTARRGGGFEICAIAVEGGAETRLTSGFEHVDGPEFSADGRFIWFNGQRGGEMHLWRMRRDGTEPVQMTRGRAMSWFPHPRPGGDEVLHIAFPDGTRGLQRGIPASLRLLDPASGAVRILREITGGQDSLNTPPWSPDGRRFAFVELA